MSRAVVPGRGWAYTGAALGGIVSIAANVAHSFIPPHGAALDWRPEPGAVVGAIVWPVFLFVAVEILARVTWPAGMSWQLLRWGGMLPVAVVAAFVSYRHLSGLLVHYGEESLVSVLGPLAVDGLMVMATGALLATARHRTIPATPAPAPVRAVAVPPTSGPITVPAATAGSTPTAPSPVDTTPVTQAVPTPAQVATRISPPVPASPPVKAATARPAPAAARTRTTTPASTARQLAPSATDTPVTAPRAAQLSPPAVPPGLLARVREEAAAYRAEHGTPITAGQLAVRLKVSSEQAAQALAVLQHDSPSPNGAPVKAAR